MDLDGSYNDADNPDSPSAMEAPNNNSAGTENQGPRFVLDFVMKFCDRTEDVVESHLSELGVATLSDLGVLDLDESFKGLLKAVQIGKLKVEYNRIISNKNQEGQKGDIDLIDFNHVFSSVQKKLLVGKRRLSRTDRLSISRSVADDLHASLASVNYDTCSKVARCLESQFTESLGSEVLTDSAKGLATQIYDRIKYRKRLDRKDRVAAQSPASCIRNFTKAQNSGIDTEQDFPSKFPDGETRETQEAKRIKIKTDGAAGEINGKNISKLMKETYVPQRIPVHNKSVDEVLADWPYFGRFGIFKNHFYELMGIDGDSVGKKMNDVCPKYLKFFEAEGNKKRKGEGEVISQDIRKVLTEFNKHPQTAELEFVTVILCVASKLKQDLSHIFLYFETTSFDEIQASTKLPKDGRPIIAVLGNIMNNAECFVLVDNTMMSTTKLPPLKAILCAFMSYFVFKITYPKKMAVFLEFIQRSIFDIGGDLNCSRTERKKTATGWESAPKPISSRYLTLMREFEDYTSLWNQG